jgi:hypothetical protein
MLLKLARKFIVVVSCFLFWKEPPWFSSDGMTGSAFRLQFFYSRARPADFLVHGVRRIHPVPWSHQGGGTTCSGMSLLQVEVEPAVRMHTVTARFGSQARCANCRLNASK